MRLHRFYTGDIKLKEDFWLHEEKLLWQWNKVLRFRSGQEVTLFDDQGRERLYKISELSKREAHLEVITDIEPKALHKHVYLFWSLLKKENNEHIIQKCTEIGVSNFIPVITGRTIKKDFNLDRARKIAIEASEQCGRNTIPVLREPLHLGKALEEYKDKIELFVCQEEGEADPKPDKSKKIGLLVGPEGGWNEAEQKMFSKNGFKSLGLGDFTLRAETAAIVAASKFL